MGGRKAALTRGPISRLDPQPYDAFPAIGVDELNTDRLDGAADAFPRPWKSCIKRNSFIAPTSYMLHGVIGCRRDQHSR